MTSFQINGRQISSEKLSWMIEDFENGFLPAEERAGLLLLLQESYDARAIYLEYCELSALLQIKAETDREKGILPVLSGKQRYAMSYSLLAAAAVIVITAIVASFIALRKPEVRSMALEATAGTSWSISGDGSNGESMVSTVVEGSKVEVSTGTVSLEIEDGPRLIVQGPALVRFPTLESPVVEKGWLWVDSRGGKRMEIQTPQGVLRNIGTRFGVRVKDKELAELHLIDGSVEVTWKSGQPAKLFGVTGEGVVFSHQGVQDKTTLGLDPFPGIDEMLSSELNYPAALMSQSPTGYWRLEATDRVPSKMDGESIAVNHVKDDADGIYALGVKPGVPGVRPTEGFHGFTQENRGVFMSGEGDSSVVYRLDSNGGVSRQEGAVSLWFRRQENRQLAEALWFAGDGAARGLDSHDQMNIYLSKEGAVGFFVKQGRHDISLSSETVASDGKWHHVVATWSRETVSLFLDGQKVDSDNRMNTESKPDFVGRYVRVGKVGSTTGPDIKNNIHSYKGWIDEVALWRRTLTPTEVRRQYRVALGQVERSGRE